MKAIDGCLWEWTEPDTFRQNSCEYSFKKNSTKYTVLHAMIF